MKIGFISLGCPKNQLDTEVMLHELASAGYEITPDETEADVIVVNTCAFIEAAKKEAIDNILDVAWLKENRNLRGIVVAGCLAERYREEILKELPEVDAVIGTGSVHDVVAAVGAVGRGERGYCSFGDASLVALGGDRVLTTPAFSTYLKIAEGCDNRCAYCVIPFLRGKFRSRPVEELVAEAKQLEALGALEINVIAQDITRYGQDLYGEYSLARLLRELSAATEKPRFRLLYCYPDKVTDELIREIATNDRIIKYIDLPLQHISDNMLRAMNRHGDGKMIRTLIEKLRREIPEIVIRTTFITGFPGETEEDFCELYDFVNEVEFDRLGVFPYSREEGTAAYDMPCQIDEQTKQDRADVIMRRQTEIADEKNRKKIGKRIKVLAEDYDPVLRMYFGRSEADAPDIDGKVYFTASSRVEPGEIVTVEVTEVVDYDLCGKVCAK